MDSLFLYGSAVAAVKLLICGVGWRGKPSRAELIGHVTRLSVYPVKSMGGIHLEEAECNFLGMRIRDTQIQDRCWMVTYEGEGAERRFVTARQEPTLLLIQPSVLTPTSTASIIAAEGAHDVMGEGVRALCFDAPGMETIQIDVMNNVTSRDKNGGSEGAEKIKVWGYEVEYRDSGDEAAAWISRYLNKPGHRLVYHDPLDPNISARNARTPTRQPMFYREAFKPQDKMVFHDDAPYLLATQASLDELSRRANDPTVTMETFRPSIVVTGGAPAFDEDQWNELFIGSQVKLSTVMPCSRCLLTTVDEKKGKRRENNEPLTTLRSFRRILKVTDSPLFGTYLVCDRPGLVKLGDPIYALRHRPNF